MKDLLLDVEYLAWHADVLRRLSIEAPPELVAAGLLRRVHAVLRAAVEICALVQR